MDMKTAFLNGVVEEEVYIEELRDLRLEIGKHMFAS